MKEDAWVGDHVAERGASDVAKPSDRISRLLSGANTRWRRYVIRLVQIIVLLAIGIFWGRDVLGNWQEFAHHAWRVEGGFLGLAFLLLLVQILLLALIWWRGLVLVGTRIPWHQGVALWLQAQIARYLPGGVWDVAVRLVLGQQIGVSKQAMSVSMGLEIGIQVLSAALFFVLSLLAWARGALHAYIALAGGTLAISLITISPPVFDFLVQNGSRILKLPPLPVQLTYWDLLALLAARFFAHGLMGLGFVLFVRGLTTIPWSSAVRMIGAYVGAWLVGYVAILMPMGIGVRESVLALLLKGETAVGVIVVAALGYRVWIALRDLLAALLGLGLLHVITRRRSLDDG
ncbi:MAG: hypothetical protein J7M34_00125 [Anaerolineae bacterium]|nr:hypothetical protein [Anaerolineae bacterium]